jgi:hypothetical protein
MQVKSNVYIDIIIFITICQATSALPNKGIFGLEIERCAVAAHKRADSKRKEEERDNEKDCRNNNSPKDIFARLFCGLESRINLPLHPIKLCLYISIHAQSVASNLFL